MTLRKTFGFDHKPLTRIQLVTRVLVWTTPVVWIAWDVYAWCHERTDGTESHYVWTLAQRWWWWPIALAVAAIWLWCHFFIDPTDPIHKSWFAYWRVTRRGIEPTPDNPEHRDA